ncbi:rolling circle replication-associated protein [Thaumasiovibrio subtropicus]|uniref:rolling circle replication-associated protein n=1 Tax=Thaumasiovibrio subtropicus TaxID=1891207 RepID=UPI000B359D1D|nr:hypothetical protein [Thaumasiovibrio subtropicus]
MNKDELLNIASAVKPADIIERNIASYDAGFLGFGFMGPPVELATNEQWWEMNRVFRDSEIYARKEAEAFKPDPKFIAYQREKILARSAAQSAEKNRLVQGRKSPTRNKDPRHITKLTALRRSLQGVKEFDDRTAMQPESLYDSADRAKMKPRVSTIQLLHQEWSGKYRLQHIVEMAPSDAPEANDGDRYTDALTPRAVGKIFESAAYVATCHEGFNTFATLTCTTEMRNAIFEGKTTLGKEVSRFIDGIRKMFRRGWQGIDADGEPFEHEERIDDLHYLWVAECPANEDGEPNPHIHLLTNWKVGREHFDAWAERIEGLWGKGMVHLERIRNPKAAGTYIIKAVGYAAKGGNANQGLIKGNRYGIAQPSRAPGWTCLDRFEADNMVAIIKECGYKLEQWRKPYERQLRKLTKKREETIRAIGVLKQKKDSPDQLAKLRAKLKRIQEAYSENSKTLKSRGVFASTKNRFCLHFDGEDAEDKMDDFLMWAAGARGWSMTPTSGDNCLEVRNAARTHYAEQRRRWREKLAYWKAVLREPLFEERWHDRENDICAALCRDYLDGATLMPTRPSLH